MWDVACRAPPLHRDHRAPGLGLAHLIPVHPYPPPEAIPTMLEPDKGYASPRQKGKVSKAEHMTHQPPRACDPCSPALEVRHVQGTTNRHPNDYHSYCYCHRRPCHHHSYQHWHMQTPCHYQSEKRYCHFVRQVLSVQGLAFTPHVPTSICLDLLLVHGVLRMKHLRLQIEPRVIVSAALSQGKASQRVDLCISRRLSKCGVCGVLQSQVVEPTFPCCSRLLHSRSTTAHSLGHGAFSR